MAGRYGSKNVQDTDTKFKKSARDVSGRITPVSYDGVGQGILGALGNIKEWKDTKDKEAGAIDAMGLHGVVTPGASNPQDKTREHMEGQAFVATYRKDYMAESEKYQDLPDNQYDVKMKQFQMKAYTGKSRDFVLGAVAGGGIEVDDTAVANRHTYQRKQIAGTYTSGAGQRAENAVYEEVDGATMIAKLDFERTTGKDNYANSDAVDKSFYNAAAGMLKENGSYGTLKDMAFTVDANGKRLIDGPLGETIRRDLAYTKKKQDSGKVNQAFLTVKDMKLPTGAPDRKKAEEYLDQRMKDDPEFTLVMRNAALQTLQTDHATRVNEELRLENKNYKDSFESALGLYRDGDLKGALDVFSNDANISNSDAVPMINAIQTKLSKEGAESAGVLPLGAFTEAVDDMNYTIKDFTQDAQAKGIKLDVDTIAAAQRMIDLGQGPDKDQYKQVKNTVSQHLGFTQLTGFKLPNQIATAKTLQAINERIAKTQKAGEEVDWQDYTVGARTPGHWLHEMIKDNQPSLTDAMNQKLGLMGLDDSIKSGKAAPRKWNIQMDKYLKTMPGAKVNGLDAVGLKAYVRSQDGFNKSTDQGIHKLMSNEKRRKQIIEAYIKANN